MKVRILQSGIRQLQEQLSDGLEAVGDRVYQVAYGLAPVETERDPAYTRDRLHVDKSHSREWPRPAVFVVTGSGDGFFVHEGTADTPPQPFLSQAVDQVRSQVPGIMRSESRGREYGISRR